MKLYQKFTHPDDRPRDRERRSRADRHRRVQGGIEPLARAGSSAPLLAQFPSSFQSTPEAREYLGVAAADVRGYPVAVELRHRSVERRSGETRNLLNA